MSASLSTLSSSLTFAGRRTLMNIILGISSYLILKHFIFNPTPLNDLNQIISFLGIKGNLMTDSEAWIAARSSAIQATSMATFMIALLFGTRDYVLPSRSTATLILSTLLYFSAGGPRWVIMTLLVLRLTAEYFLEKMGIDERADFKLCSITIATTVFLWIPATLDVLLQNYPIEESIHP
ncbi:hypothetical protein [Actinomyces oris]